MNAQKGFSLIELMVAVAMSAVLLLGLSQIFIANKQSFTTATSYAHVQESGRFATEMIARDIRMADYWGCLRDTGVILDHLDITDSDYDESMSFTGATGVSGLNDVVSGLSYGGIAVKAGTDILTLRGTEPFGVKVSEPYMNTVASDIHVTLNPGVDIPLGQIILITDCTSGDLFSNTATNTATGENILHGTGHFPDASGLVDNAFKDTSVVYKGDAQILAPYTKDYFIGQNPQGGWSLYLNKSGSVSEYVRDVSDLQFIYGEDTGGNGSVDTFNDACTPVAPPEPETSCDMDDALSIRAVVTAESDSDTDEALSRNYSITANIRNRTL